MNDLNRHEDNYIQIKSLDLKLTFTQSCCNFVNDLL